MEDNKQEEIIRYFENDRFAALTGAQLLSASPGHAEARLALAPFHRNAAGGVQGGAFFTLCDFAFAAAVNAGGSLTVSVSASIQYFKQPRGSFVTATANVISAGRRLCGCTVDVCDEDGTLLARFEGTGYSRGERFPR